MSRDGECISYEMYRSLRTSQARITSPLTYLRLSRGLGESIPVSVLTELLSCLGNVERLSCQVQFYGVGASGHLNESEIEAFVFDVASSLRGLEELDADFKQFYVYTAVRKFMFLLDTRRIGGVLIRDFVSSKILEELFSLRGGAQPSSNWFSLASTTTVYTRYIDMDVDGDGMLSREEMTKYPCAMFTKVAIDRIFQEHMTFEGMLDYKGYLDLVLALENPSSQVSIKYMWKLLDVHKKGVLDFSDIVPFLKAIMDTLHVTVPTAGYCMYKPDNIFREFLDSLGILDRDFLQVEDLIEGSKNGLHVCPMLIDGQAFYQHDNREHTFTAHTQTAN